MEQETVLTLTTNFEAHAQETENGIEFWLARDLQHLLQYSKWDDFLNEISKAKTACEVSNHAVLDHFADVGKLVDLGSTTRFPQYHSRLFASNSGSERHETSTANERRWTRVDL